MHFHRLAIVNDSRVGAFDLLDGVVVLTGLGVINGREGDVAIGIVLFFGDNLIALLHLE